MISFWLPWWNKVHTHENQQPPKVLSQVWGRIMMLLFPHCAWTTGVSIDQTAMFFVRAWGGQVDLWNRISLAETNVAYISWIGRNLPTLVNCQPPLPAALHWLCIISCPGWCLLWDKEKLTVIQTVIQNTSTQLCSFHVDREMLLLKPLRNYCLVSYVDKRRCGEDILK